MGRRKKMNPDSGVHNEWLATYSDTITLLLTFFILLYSFSIVDAKKFESISNALQSLLSGSGGSSVTEYTTDSGNLPVETQIKNEIKTSELLKKLNKEIKEEGLQDKVTVSGENKGVVIEFSDNVLFDSGKAVLKETSLPILNKLSDIIKGIDNDIVVEGHTDNVPIQNSEFKSNWELSCFRAVNVIKYFIEINKISPARLSAVGYGEYKPIVQNDSDANRSKNRRVNIMILYNKGEYSSNE